MSYRVIITRKAAKQIENLPGKSRDRVIHKIEQLGATPRPVGCKKLTDSGAYRIRIGDYRVVYSIEDNILTVEIIEVDHRKQIYK